MAPLFYLSLPVPANSACQITYPLSFDNVICRETLLPSFKILNSSKYIGDQLISLELEVTVEHDENVGRSTWKLDRITSSFCVETCIHLHYRKTTYTVTCIIIYIFDIMYF